MRERCGALSFAAKENLRRVIRRKFSSSSSFLLSFCPSSLLLLCRFLESKPILNYILFHRYESRYFVVLSSSGFCRFVAFDLVVLYLKQIREPRGALLFAPKEETCGEINCRRFLLADSFGD